MQRNICYLCVGTCPVSVWRGASEAPAISTELSCTILCKCVANWYKVRRVKRYYFANFMTYCATHIITCFTILRYFTILLAYEQDFITISVNFISLDSWKQKSLLRAMCQYNYKFVNNRDRLCNLMLFNYASELDYFPIYKPSIITFDNRYIPRIKIINRIIHRNYEQNCITFIFLDTEQLIQKLIIIIMCRNNIAHYPYV